MNEEKLLGTHPLLYLLLFDLEWNGQDGVIDEAPEEAFNL